MRKFLSVRYTFIGGIFLFLIILGLDLQDDYRKKGKFRTMQDPIESTEKVDLTGLRDLQVAGAPILPLSDLKKRLSSSKTDKIIVDSTRGKCGYVYGIPICGYQEERAPSWKKIFWRLYYTGTIYVHPELEISAVNEAKMNGFAYRHFAIGSKVMSSDQTVDTFVNFFDTLPENTLVYFHCHHGKG